MLVNTCGSTELTLFQEKDGTALHFLLQIRTFNTHLLFTAAYNSTKYLCLAVHFLWRSPSRRLNEMAAKGGNI